MQPVHAQIIDLGIFRSVEDPDILEIRLRPAKDIENWSYSGGIFTVRFPAAYGVGLEVIPGTSPYQYVFAGPAGEYAGYRYYRFQFAGAVYPVEWRRDAEYPVLSIRVTGVQPPYSFFELVSGEEWTERHNGNYYQELKGTGMQGDFYQAITEMFLFPSSAMEEVHPQSSCRVSPNPAVGHIALEFESTVLEGTVIYGIWNQVGRLVQRGKLDKKNMHLDLSALPASTYWIQVLGASGQVFNCSVVLTE